MLEITGLYKEKENNLLNEIDFALHKGKSISLECSNEISDLLFDLILGKEIPAKGKISIDGISSVNLTAKDMKQIGIVMRNEAFYEGMTIRGYMEFFNNVLGATVDYKEILLKLALLDIENSKIKSLNYSQRRRLSLARERLKHPKLLILQEPILNMDREGAKIIVENIDELCMNGTAVLVTSVFFKNTIMMGERAYRIDKEGLVEINRQEEPVVVKESDEIVNTSFQIDKIPAKIEDKILLFDPIEIDYIESDQGVSQLYIRGESFPCNLSLTELEERLKCFGFFRCHRSYLINLQRVKEVITWSRNSYSLILGDKMKSSIPLSKGRLEELKTIIRF